MNIFVDIDGTICETPGVEYTNAKPLPERIDKINTMYDRGHRITYWTGRGTLSGKDYSALTRNQLQTWGCKYHEVMFHKPVFDLYICDKVQNIKNQIGRAHV